MKSRQVVFDTRCQSYSLNEKQAFHFNNNKEKILKRIFDILYSKQYNLFKRKSKKFICINAKGISSSCI